ncbi:MAG: S41 family peptidase [Candidatus Acidiferrales bacterium]
MGSTTFQIGYLVSILALALCGATHSQRAKTPDIGKLSRGLSPINPDLRTQETTIPLDERVFVATKIYALVRERFFYRSSLPNLDVSYKEYLRKVLATGDRRQFDFATMEFMASLQNGHTTFWDSWLGVMYGQGLGFYASPLDGKWVVRNSSLDDLKPGDIIASIDNVQVKDFFMQQQKYISGSSEAAQEHNLFLLPHLFPEQFLLGLYGGRTVSVKRRSLTGHQESVAGRWLKEHEVAYVRIPTFFSPIFEENALAYVRQFEQAKAIVIDVRNNPGGIPPTRLIEALMNQPYRGWKESTYIRIGSFDYEQATVTKGESNMLPDYSRGYIDALSSLGGSEITWEPRLVLPNPTAYQGKVLLLVDGGCASACEDFVEPFKDNHRALLIGETTEGTSGLPYFYDFGNGMSVRIAVKREYFPDGSEFEGVGIKPDVEVQTSIDDLRHGRDAVLERALGLFHDPEARVLHQPQ